jgi:hypothetical protein
MWMKIHNSCVGILGVFLLLLPSLAFSQAKVGTTGVNFLELGVSARAMGMAEAYIAGVTDASAVYYNPAALTYVYGREVMFTHIDMPADIDYEAFALAYPMESIGGILGIGVYALNAGDILRTDYHYFSSMDQYGQAQYFTASDLAIGLSYGRFLTDRFSLGFTVKYIQESLETERASGWGADVGTCYNSGYRNFKIGMMISNFGPDMKFIEKEFPLPINFRFGAAIDVMDRDDHLVTLAAEGSHPADNLEKYNVGMEYQYLNRFSLRLGERFNYDIDGFTAGGGLILPLGEEMDIYVDYAYQDFGLLTEVHRFTIGLVF